MPHEYMTPRAGIVAFLALVLTPGAVWWSYGLESRPMASLACSVIAAGWAAVLGYAIAMHRVATALEALERPGDRGRD